MEDKNPKDNNRTIPLHDTSVLQVSTSTGLYSSLQVSTGLYRSLQVSTGLYSFGVLCLPYSIVKDSNADLGVIFRFLQNSPITKAVCTKISKFFFAFLAKF